MANTENEIKTEIKEHINKESSNYNKWYVGITNNVERRLFREHQVSKENGWWIYRTATSSDIARSIEKYFLDLGLDGGGGGGDESAKMVYAYKKTFNTNP